MITGGLPQETELLSITAAPVANQQVKPKPESLSTGKRLIEEVGLDSGYLAASRHECAKSSSQGFRDFLQELHAKPGRKRNRTAGWSVSPKIPYTAS